MTRSVLPLFTNSILLHINSICLLIYLLELLSYGATCKFTINCNFYKIWQKKNEIASYSLATCIHGCFPALYYGLAVYVYMWAIVVSQPILAVLFSFLLLVFRALFTNGNIIRPSQPTDYPGLKPLVSITLDKKILFIMLANFVRQLMKN